MKIKINMFTWLNTMFKEFIDERIQKPLYEIADIFECKKTGAILAIIKFSSTKYLAKKLSEIMNCSELLEGFDKKTIQTLTYIATMENMKPEYSIAAQMLTDKVDNFILEIKSKNNKNTIRKSPSEISKDKKLINKFSQLEAHRIGYMTGIRDAVMDFENKANL